MTTHDDFLAAVTAGDTADLEPWLVQDPTLAEARDGHGVSAALLAAHHGRAGGRAENATLLRAASAG